VSFSYLAKRLDENPIGSERPIGVLAGLQNTVMFSISQTLPGLSTLEGLNLIEFEEPSSV